MLYLEAVHLKQLTLRFHSPFFSIFQIQVNANKKIQF